MNLDDALAPVLRDVASTYPLPVSVTATTPAGVRGSDELRWIRVNGESAAVGIATVPTDDPVDHVVRVADQTAEWLVEQLPWAGLPATWPSCPKHPDTHPLDAPAYR